MVKKISENKNKRIKTSPMCGLCGRSDKKLTKTECCRQWICNDESEYKLFSYDRNSCCRNHRRFTLCSSHHTENHKGDWKTCKKCLEGLSHELEMYVWYGTNEYNFEKLNNLPKFEPTYCDECRKLIVLPNGGYSIHKGKYYCFVCSQVKMNMERTMRQNEKPKMSKLQIKQMKKEIIQKRIEIEKNIENLLKKQKSKYSLKDAKNFVYNEKEANEMQNFIFMFCDRNIDELDNKMLETITDMWNYFPHKSLGDKCPYEKFLELEN